MKKAADGLPETGRSARTLGARLDTDIEIDNAGQVHPDIGGMSVSPDDPEKLPKHRRPLEYGGSGRDPVWVIDSDNLGPRLRYRPDPYDPEGHGFLEPRTEMSFEEYERLLEQTRDRWEEPGI
jgi:hypothetical protein